MSEQFLSVWKPKYGMLGEALKSAGEGLQAADEWAHKDPLGGSSTPPLGVLSDLVGVGGLGRVLEGAAYGQNKITTGKGFTLKPTDDAIDAVKDYGFRRRHDGRWPRTVCGGYPRARQDVHEIWRSECQIV